MGYRLFLDKIKMFEESLPIDFEDKQFNRAVVKLMGLVVPSPGKLEARMMLGRKKLGSCAVRLLKIKDPEVQKKESSARS